jgi:hypothetical protein
MPNIEELRKNRFQYLNCLYEESGGNEHNHLNCFDLGEELGFSRDEVITITQYLAGEGLMEHVTLGGGIAITHFGVKEVEEALSHPERESHYFPPVNIIQIQHMENSQIQQGSIDSSQKGTFNSTGGAELTDFLKLLKSKLPELKLLDSDQAELGADVDTINSQVGSSRPKTGIIKECLMSIKRILEGAGGNVVAKELLSHIPALLALVG